MIRSAFMTEVVILNTEAPLMKHIGDALIRAPRRVFSHEDDKVRAVRTAIEMRKPETWAYGKERG